MRRLAAALALALAVAAPAQGQVTQRFDKVIITSTAPDALKLVGGSFVVDGHTVTVTGDATLPQAGLAEAPLTLGAHLSGGSYDGSAPVTTATDGTSANTAGTLVARDGSGNFSAGTITATLAGTATAATSATTADQVAHALTISTHLTGGSYDGSGAVTLATDAATANTASTLVARDGSGDFAAGTVSLTAATATRLDIRTTGTDGVVLQNTTPATLAIPVQYSPRSRWSGPGWDTDDALSRTVTFYAQTEPTSGTTVGGSWILHYVNPVTAALSAPLEVSSAGAITTSGTARFGGSVGGTSFDARGTPGAGNGYFVALNGSGFFWDTRSGLTSPANGQLNVTNQAVDTGVGLDFSTDALLKLRTRAQSGYATLDLLGLKSSGTPGASCNVTGATATLTVVNGIVTSCS